MCGVLVWFTFHLLSVCSFVLRFFVFSSFLFVQKLVKYKFCFFPKFFFLVCFLDASSSLRSVSSTTLAGLEDSIQYAGHSLPESIQQTEGVVKSLVGTQVSYGAPGSFVCRLLAWSETKITTPTAPPSLLILIQCERNSVRECVSVCCSVLLFSAPTEALRCLQRKEIKKQIRVSILTEGTRIPFASKS